MSEINTRCPWSVGDELYEHYHDTEWGVPKADDRLFFEKLCLEGFQAGLSWITVLRKRERFREVFDGFDPEKIVRYDDKKIAALMQDEGIIRNRLKINAAVSNARAFLDFQEKQSFSAFFWGYVDGRPVQNRFDKLSDIPAETETSKKISKELKKAGFKFCGPTIVYAFMESLGLMNDHLVSCPCHEECRKIGERFEVTV